MSDDGTESLVDPPRPSIVGRGELSLVLVMNAAHPLERSRRFEIAEDVDAIVLSRGPDLLAAANSGKGLRIELPDRAVSSNHACIDRMGEGWAVTDQDSRNGTLLNGERVTSARLAPDDLLEIGNCFFVMHEDAVMPRPEPAAFRTLSAPFARELELVTLVATSKLPLLIVGETGTGKDLVARTAHELSGRRGPFVAVNCGAIPPSLVESELFGARRGAFSGAIEDRLGTIAAADKGTLFLDEIAELPEPSQAALLRFLQDGEVKALGAARPGRVDVRVIAATNRDLDELVAAGRFRNDLYARLRSHVTTLPPLRSRREDLGFLVATLLQRAAGDRASTIAFQRGAARALLRYAWPHNIRELEQVLARALALLDGGDEIRIEHLPDSIANPTRATAPASAPNERDQLVELLRRHAGNVSAVARALSTSRSQVRRLLDRHGLAPTSFRSG